MSSLQILDLFCRLILIGQLSVFAVLLLKKDNVKRSQLWLVLAVCLSGYLLLTSPLPDQTWEGFRGVLLLLTELAPYAIWLVAMTSLRDDFRLIGWSRAVQVLFAAGLLWFIYFFVVRQGQGLFHQINHVLAILALLHVVAVALLELNDDLVDSRRKQRIALVIYFAVFTSLMALLELADASIRSAAVFGLVKTIVIWLPLSYLGWHWLNQSNLPPQFPVYATNETPQCNDAIVLPVHYQRAHNTLLTLMSEGFYRQPELTVKVLADAVSLPEHQLRELINKHLGYDNFSTFLNSYRIPAACAAMKDLSNHRKPILTLALELGYGSIGPFNRAFKAQLGLTPSEFRRQFQK